MYFKLPKILKQQVHCIARRFDVVIHTIEMQVFVDVSAQIRSMLRKVIQCYYTTIPSGRYFAWFLVESIWSLLY